MFKIFISAQALARTYLYECSRTNTSTQSNWCRILMKQKNIYTIGYENIMTDDETSDEYVLFLLTQSNPSIRIIPEDKYLKDIEDNPERVLENPSAIFYLDIPSKVAKKIRDSYGIICYSTQNKINIKSITTESSLYTCKKNKPSPSWREIYESTKALPGNALCIIDRNLFVYDGQIRNNREQIPGLKNLFMIIYNALPPSLDTEYHITIITELRLEENDQTAINVEYMQKLTNSLNEQLLPLIKQNKDYPIIIEFIALKKKANFYNNFTHNRQIISNYYRIKAENGLCILNPETNKSYYNQDVETILHYSTGLRNKTSCPVDMANHMYEQLSHFIEYLKNVDETTLKENYWYFNSDYPLNIFKNRLFQ